MVTTVSMKEKTGDRSKDAAPVFVLYDLSLRGGTIPNLRNKEKSSSRRFGTTARSNDSDCYVIFSIPYSISHNLSRYLL